jgi:hypothetical protein
MSVASDGTPGNDWAHSWLHAISHSGRFVVFDSDAQNLTPGINTGHNIFVRDRDLDRDRLFDEPGAVATARVTLSTSGAEPDYGGSYEQTAISRGGRFVVFVHDATNFGDGDSGLNPDIFLRDRNTDGDRRFDEANAVKTVRVNLSSAGQEANDWSWFPVVSPGGRFVAFQSLASNLVGDDDNGAWDIYIRDRNTDGDRRFDETGAVATTRISLSSDGAQANSDSQFPQLSRNSRFVAFSSYADNLADGDANGFVDVFVRDRDSDKDGVFDEPGAVATVRVSTSSAGEEGDGESDYPAITASGRFVMFRSSASNLVAGDTNGVNDVFVHDRDTDRDGIYDEPGAVRTERVSVSSDGAEGDGAVFLASISASGRFVAFDSFASNLVGDDTNATYDVFVRDRDTDNDKIFDELGAVATFRANLTQAGTESSEGSGTPSISGNGRWVVFDSAARDLHGLNGPNPDVFVHGPLH